MDVLHSDGHHCVAVRAGADNVLSAVVDYRMTMRRVIIESPYAGDVEANTAYARKCLHDSLNRGEAPFASHLIYTQPGVLNDLIPHERSWGIRAGYTWMEISDEVVFYIDRGWSRGMLEALKMVRTLGKPHRGRSLFGQIEPYEFPLT